MRTKLERDLQEMDAVLIDLGYNEGPLLGRFCAAMSELSTLRGRIDRGHGLREDTQPMADSNGLPLPPDLVVGGRVDLTRPVPNPAVKGGHRATLAKSVVAPTLPEDDEGMFPGFASLFRRPVRP